LSVDGSDGDGASTADVTADSFGASEGDGTAPDASAADSFAPEGGGDAPGDEQ
jgi:hypothetical protein